jgi:16S rRNA (uracil1498-N3)-methyltransferase
LVLEECSVDRESPLTLTLAFGLSRGAKPDWIIEKATELGVSAILPFTSERTLRSSERHDRWQRLAAAAARQSGRARCPEIAEVSSFADILELGARSELALLFHAAASEFPAVLRESCPRSVLAVTGPEGGFSESEVSAAREFGFRIVTLGPRTLRAETAGITVAALCQAFWGDLVGGS